MTSGMTRQKAGAMGAGILLMALLAGCRSGGADTKNQPPVNNLHAGQVGAPSVSANASPQEKQMQEFVRQRAQEALQRAQGQGQR